MKIDFFNTCNGMDPRAINHGVSKIFKSYMVFLNLKDLK